MNKTKTPLIRRGFDLGSVSLEITDEPPHLNRKERADLTRWQRGQAVFLEGICTSELDQHQADLRQAEKLYVAILDECECDELLAQTPYSERLKKKFAPLGCSINAGDDQEIETALFDALDSGETIAEDLWMKVAWLSFHEEDASLRFRFSFGVDHAQDVAADQLRQQCAAELTDAIFPESRVISQNNALNVQLKALLNSDSVRFVERIIYFNSPNGGAYLHHDRERGHAGVVYAQLSGETYWLALPKQILVSEIAGFVRDCKNNNRWAPSLSSSMQSELARLVTEPGAVSDQLDTFANSTLIHLINETQEFVQHLIQQGYGQRVRSGDALLLPQENDDNCCWHSVFNLGKETGQALSFAIRGA